MNLIYYTVGGDIKHVDMLKYSIQSLRLFGKYKGDILIISDNICLDKVKEYFPDCKILHIKNESKHCEASINKLRIYKYEDISKYDKIIFLDLDILVQNDIADIFDSIQDKFIFSNEYYPETHSIRKIIDDSGYGKDLFSEYEYEKYDIKNKRAINGGFFGFRVSMISHFEKILLELEKDRVININNNQTWYCEQPTINKYMITHEVYDDNISDKILQFATYYKTDNIDISKKILLHFCGGVGNYNGKINSIKQWFNYLKGKKILQVIEDREKCLDYIKNQLKNNPNTCEIGFFKGDFSKVIKNKLESKKHYVIDTFDELNYRSGDKDGLNFQYQNMREMYDYSISLGYNTIKGTSDNLVNIDDKLDFIYIDADHSYGWVMRDLENAYNKIEDGGIISGHDYSEEHFEECFRAVNDFCKLKNQSISVISNDGCPSFFIKINKGDNF